MIAAKERLPVAPAAAANRDDRTGVVLAFRDEVRLVFDQLRIQTQHPTQCSFDLSRSVIARLKAAHRSFDQPMQDRNVPALSETYLNGRYGHRQTIISAEIGIKDCGIN